MNPRRCSPLHKGTKYIYVYSHSLKIRALAWEGKDATGICLAKRTQEVSRKWPQKQSRTEDEEDKGYSFLLLYYYCC